MIDVTSTAAAVSAKHGVLLALYGLSCLQTSLDRRRKSRITIYYTNYKYAYNSEVK